MTLKFEKQFGQNIAHIGPIDLKGWGGRDYYIFNLFCQTNLI